MSNVEENYLDNLLKNVMEPHPVQPRERGQDEEDSVENEVTDFSLDELEADIAEPIQYMEEAANMEDDMLDLDALEKELDLGDLMNDADMLNALDTDNSEFQLNTLDSTNDDFQLDALESGIETEEAELKLDTLEMDESDFQLDTLQLDDDEFKMDELDALTGLDDDLLKDMELLSESAPVSELPEEDFGDVLNILNEEDDSDLAEINDLLKKSDNKELVQDDMMELLSQMAEDEEKQFDENVQADLQGTEEVSEEVIQSDTEIVEAVKKSGKKNEKKKAKKEKAVKKQKTDADGKIVEKKPGMFARLFNTLTEEFEPEPTEEELAEEAAKKAAAKEEAKAKKVEEKKVKAEENKVKAEEKEAAKKAKAEAAAQKKKEKQELKEAKRAAKLAKQEAERPKNQKRISPKKMILVTIFAASVLAVVLLFSNFVSYEGSLQRARKAYYAGNYETVYVELYGSKLEASDALVQIRSKVILKMQRKYDSYVNHTKMGHDVKALNALLEGLRTYDEINREAEQCGVLTEVDEIKDKIINVLNAKYGLDETAARELLQNEDEISYTKALNHIIMENSSESL